MILNIEQVLTPSKLEYVLSILNSVKSRSKDPSTKVGAVAFDDLTTLRILSTGYNGFARGMVDNYSIPRETKYRLTVHAEANLVANAACNGVSLRNSTVIISEPPCTQCLSLLINSGVTNIVSPKWEDCKHYDRWKDQFDLSATILRLSKEPPQYYFYRS